MIETVCIGVVCFAIGLLIGTRVKVVKYLPASTQDIIRMFLLEVKEKLSQDDCEQFLALLKKAQVQEQSESSNISSNLRQTETISKLP